MKKSAGGAGSGGDGHPNRSHHLGSGSARKRVGLETGCHNHHYNEGGDPPASLEHNSETGVHGQYCPHVSHDEGGTRGGHTLMFTKRIPSLLRLSRLQTRQLIHHRIRRVTRHRIRRATRHRSAERPATGSAE